MRFLFVDSILESIPGEYIRGIKQVTSNDYYLSVDVHGHLYFPSSLIGETLGQLTAWNVMQYIDFEKRPVAGVVADVKVHRPAFVGDTLQLESFIDALDDVAVQYHSVAHVNGTPVLTIEGALGPLLPMEGFIDQKTIRQQFSQIYHHERPSLSGQYQPQVLCFDTITHSEPGYTMTATKYIDPSASYFPDHFPKKPVLPMTILLECKLNLAREFLNQANYSGAYQIREMRRIKMNEFVYPGDTLNCTLNVKRQNHAELVLSFRSEVNGKRVCVMELFLEK